MIFLTLMLPVEVRILPTYKVVADVFEPLNWLVSTLGLEGLIGFIVGHKVDLSINLSFLDSYAGLILPLIASATATFLFRQFFLTIPTSFWRRPASTGPGRSGSSGKWSCRSPGPTSRPCS
jgi:sn-glycerol 3-phosphate transport system permease protein